MINFNKITASFPKLKHFSFTLIAGKSIDNSGLKLPKYISLEVKGLEFL